MLKRLPAGVPPSIPAALATESPGLVKVERAVTEKRLVAEPPMALKLAPLVDVRVNASLSALPAVSVIVAVATHDERYGVGSTDGIGSLDAADRR